MESDDETISELEFDFSEEELQEALKRKGGRPSNRTRELRERLKEAQQFKDIMGILNSGILERLSEDMGRGFRPSDIRGPIRVDDKGKKPQSTPEGFTAELLLKTGLVNQKFIETNRNVLGLTDEVVSTALIKYGPIVAVLAGVWIAESQIEDMPPTLHTIMSILTQTLRLLNVIGTFFTDGLGGLVDLIKDPLGTLAEPITFGTIEEQQTAIREQHEKQKEKAKTGVGILSRKGVG